MTGPDMPFMKRLRGLATFSAIGTYPADTLLSDVQMIIVEVDWLRNERDRLHQMTEQLGDERDALRVACEAAVTTEEEDPCWYDHHGNCQAHGLQPKGECYMELIRAALAMAKGEDKP